jgi:hypothetical protein
MSQAEKVVRSVTTTKTGFVPEVTPFLTTKKMMTMMMISLTTSLTSVGLYHISPTPGLCIDVLSGASSTRPGLYPRPHRFGSLSPAAPAGSIDEGDSDSDSDSGKPMDMVKESRKLDREAAEEA